MIRCKTHKCPKILGRITQDHCHTEDMVLFETECWFPNISLPKLLSQDL